MEAEAQESKKVISKSFIKKVSIFLLSLLILGLGSYAVYLKLIKPKDRKTKLTTMVRKMVPNPEYTTGCSIYLLAKSKEREDFVKLDLRITFSAINSLECFKNNIVPYKDIMYRFLKDQTPDRNSLRAWSSIVRNELLKHIKKNYDICKIKRINLEQLQRL